MIRAAELKRWVIRPVLAELELGGAAAEELLLGTAAVESRLGAYLDQTTPGPGPAYGIYQMEAATHDDLWDNFIRFRQPLAADVMRFHAMRPEGVAQLHGNLYYATAMARALYLRAKAPLPAAGDRAGQARYWKAHWNTELGAGTEKGFLDAWAITVQPTL
jgi:hypothetical protein